MVAESSMGSEKERASKEGKKKIIDKILSDAEAEAKDILTYAEKQVQEIMSGAMSEANAMREESLKKGRQEAATEKNRILSQARLDSRRAILEAKEKELSAILDETKAKLKDAKKIPDYDEVMRRITMEACTSIGGGDLSLKTDSPGIKSLEKEVKSLEKEISKATGVKTKLKLVDEGISGVVVESEKGVVIDNSFITRLERRKREIRKDLADIIF